ncbi:LytR C-terminal domain-containing protein [Nocardia bhagyanarayanae]|uniref:LytR cell envelope-related transcriptional attenuator n=1 Tax=Nocardia bhagyanarayanae TaxID=1215925 RepID=A0A543F8A1_9NOCA|nr:LytR C-terminal domain-containing protein [Nocardia bhagyanarayanae]TQM30064.1 LytR cell envelope-related transcriptional attenuator [Nocardia bhagyanarayanae]
MSQTNPTSGGPPLRALAMVLIALAIVFAGLGAMSLSSSDSDATNAEESSTAAQQVTSAAPVTTAATTTVATTTVAPTTTTTAAPTTTAGAPAAGVNRAVPVRVLNNSLVAGLAARTADELTASGWTNVSPGNYAGGTIAKTTVYYGNTPGEREAALAIAAEIGATAEPKSAGIGDNGPGVVVILTGN